MGLTAEERAQTERFEALYELSRSDVVQRINDQAFCCGYVGTSWTTRDEADRQRSVLGLQSHHHLLDLGSGAGWPGLYMARESGCRVTLCDLPEAGLKIAQERAARDGMSDRVSLQRADAAALPFADASFDAISHSDLLCCLLPKQAVVNECRRVIRPGGRMAFTAISIVPDKSHPAYQRAWDNAPEFAESDVSYEDMLAIAGWRIEQVEDITAEFLSACSALLQADLEAGAELETLLGSAAYQERVKKWATKRDAIADGLLRRALFVAIRPEG